MIGARSYLFVPAHRQEMIPKAHASGADSVILDLEDAVPAECKPLARTIAAEAVEQQWSWVRINAPHSKDSELDLELIGGKDCGIRIPKVESTEDIDWVRQRAPHAPLMCAIESATGVLNLQSIAASTGVTRLALGGLDLQRDLGVTADSPTLACVRSELVLVSRANGLEAPVDSVFGSLTDLEGLEQASWVARWAGFGGKSAIHPRQLDVIHKAFAPTKNERELAREILDAFSRSGGAATATEAGVFVDVPVAENARRILERE